MCTIRMPFKFRKVFGKKPKAGGGADTEKTAKVNEVIVIPGLISDPWRTVNSNPEDDWKKDFEDELISHIVKHEVKEEGVPNILILLLGRIGAGKSSFLNTIATIDKGRVAEVTYAGGADYSVTSKLKLFKPENKLKNFRVLDTMGVEDSDQGGLNLKDVLYVVEGHISPDYKFNPASPIDKNDSLYREKPFPSEKIHCVTFVVDSNVIGQDNISPEGRKKIKEMQDQLKSIDVPRIVILTKIDTLCEHVDGDIKNTYRSEKVQQAVQRVHEIYQVPERNIFPVQNYQNEMQTDFKKNILHILALRQMVYFGTDFLNATTAAKEG